MRCLSVRRSPVCQWIVLGIAVACTFGAPLTAFAAPVDPSPDPAGIATGDKSGAVDAAGNAFVVAEPADKADPDYALKKKAFDEFQASAAKEPLAMKSPIRSAMSGWPPTRRGP